MSNPEVILSVRDLHVHFTTFAGVVQAVRGVSFDLHAGETLAIVGESGSGKTVTSRAIMQLLSSNATIPSGTIDYRGQSLLEISEQEMEAIRGRKIAMIFQDPMTSLNPTMTIGEQIAEVLVKKRQFSKADAVDETLRLLDRVGLPNPKERYKQYPHQFSGGQRQRIVIAIALAGDPEILIADEPTTALDVTIQAQIIELIQEIQQETQMAVIFITHDLGVVANVSDRVAVLYAGRFVEIGPVDCIYYFPQHPYTWGLLSAVPDPNDDHELYAIPGSPPNLLNPPVGDAFACRNEYALAIDFQAQPPMFQVAPHHYAATWLLHPQAPKVTPPDNIVARYERYQEIQARGGLEKCYETH